MLFQQDHHVSQVNRNPSCIIDTVICEEIGDHQSHRVHSGTVQSFLLRKNGSEYTVVPATAGPLGDTLPC